jgi:hypothetical protein
MRHIVTPLVLAVLLFGAGFVVWTLGQAEERIARTKTQVATLSHVAVAEGDPGLESDLRYASRVPLSGEGLTNARRDAKATAEYWLSQYDALVLERDAGGALVEHDPDLLLLAANAAYRATRIAGVDRDTAVERLETLVRNYADVLKSNPDSPVLVDAAYNYELVARMRNELERAKTNAPVPARPPAAPASVHGAQGGPPKNVDKNQFKVVIPKRSDERNQNPEGGESQRRQRRG